MITETTDIIGAQASEANSFTERRQHTRRTAVALALTLFVATVWVYHGMYNKLLGGEPRHLSIVQSVPGFPGAAGECTLLTIGIIEICIAAWVLTGARPVLCASVQTVFLLGMNVAELIWARQHLLVPAGLIPVNLLFLGAVWTAAALRAGADGRRFLPLHVLQRHPLPVVARFEHCLVLTFAFPRRVLEPLLPPGLTLDTVGDWGFVAVALVRTRGLRVRGTPRFLGRDFFLAGYRIFARFRRPDGRTLRGLRILRSDTDRRLMACLGNRLTHYNYRFSEACVRHTSGGLDIRIRSRDGAGDLHVVADLAHDGVLPPESPFASLADARRFAGPLPYTFDYEPQTHSIVLIKGIRQNWRPRLVNVSVNHASFFQRPPFDRAEPVLAAAFHVRDISYEWQRGVRHALPKEES